MPTPRCRMSELSDKDFKAANLKMLQWAITNMLDSNDIEPQQNTKQENIICRD